MKPQTRNRARERDIEKTWESWSHLLYSRLEAFDHFLEAVQADLSAAGLPYSKSGEFLTDRIVEMNQKIQEEKSKKAI